MTNSNNGKITWKLLKPIIQGKILYGPISNETKDIVSFGNQTFQDMSRLREFFRAIETSVKMLNTNKEFRANFDNLLSLAKSPFVQALLGGAVDIQTIEMVLDNIVNDTRIADVIETIGNIFDCFSVDRFIPVKDEKELEDVAYELAKKKMFYAGVFFTNDGTTNETSYKLRMEVDNTPVTIENKNRFWFPGAEGNFELEMRYHRGFIEIQNSIDTAIIKHKKKKQFEEAKEESADDLDFSDLQFEDEHTEAPTSPKPIVTTEHEDFDGLKLDDNGEIDDANKSTTATTTAPDQQFDLNYEGIFKAFQDQIKTSDTKVDEFDDGDWWNSDDGDGETDSTTKVKTESDDDQQETTTAALLSRKKRQFDSILSMFGFGGDSNAEKKQEVKFEVDGTVRHTKQFPYPKHTRDDFKKGL